MSLKRKQYVVLMLMGIGLVLIMTGAVKAWGFIEGAGFLMMLSGFAADFALRRLAWEISRGILRGLWRED